MATRAHLYTSSGQAPYHSFRRKRQNSVYTVTGSYDGVETLDRKMERVMGEKFTEKMEDSE